jgi:hypothetical protein
MRLAVDKRGMQINENLLWLFGGLDSAHPGSQILPPMIDDDDRLENLKGCFLSKAHK